MNSDLTTTTNEQTIPARETVFQSEQAFVLAQRFATALSSSTIVPELYRGTEKIGNCIIAMEMAQRMQLPILVVMQNLHIIQGKPGWSSTFIIAGINQCRRFSSQLKFEWYGTEGEDNWGCRAWATDNDGNRVQGSKVTLEMAKSEGWYGKSGSKWKTMPEQMLQYRAAAFFARVHCPEIMMGIPMIDEVHDISLPTKKSIFSSTQTAAATDIPAEEVK